MAKKIMLSFALLLLCSAALFNVAVQAWAKPAAALSKTIEATEDITIQLSANEKTIKKGATFSLKTSVTPKTSGKYVRFTSSNTSVARVTQAGKVKGVSYGDVVITATYGDQIATCSVKVTGPLKKITLNAKSASIQVGQNLDLKIAAMDPFNANVDIDTARWSSSKPGVAAVSGGSVTAVGVGKTTISAKLSGKVASCTVTVTAAPGTESQSASASDPQNSGSLEAQVLKLVNAERAKAGLGKLSYYAPLEGYARVRAEEITRSFAHTRPNGTKCFTVIKYSVSWAGENIAMGYRTAEDVMQAWMNSPSHRSNILNPNFKELGVGIYQKNDTVYWTQLFTKKK